jgi:hypothetical protein
MQILRHFNLIKNCSLFNCAFLKKLYWVEIYKLDYGRSGIKCEWGFSTRAFAKIILKFSVLCMTSWFLIIVDSYHLANTFSINSGMETYDKLINLPKTCSHNTPGDPIWSQTHAILYQNIFIKIFTPNKFDKIFYFPLFAQEIYFLFFLSPT